VERKNEGDSSNNKGNWNQLRITQTVPEQHTMNARNQGTTKKKKKKKKKHIWRCKHTTESNDAKVPKV